LPFFNFHLSIDRDLSADIVAIPLSPASKGVTNDLSAPVCIVSLPSTYRIACAGNFTLTVAVFGAARPCSFGMFPGGGDCGSMNEEGDTCRSAIEADQGNA
jgi:hypothetical protein